MGFKSFNTARRTITRYEAMHMLRKGQVQGVARGRPSNDGEGADYDAEREGYDSRIDSDSILVTLNLLILTVSIVPCIRTT